MGRLRGLLWDLGGRHLNGMRGRMGSLVALAQGLLLMLLLLAPRAGGVQLWDRVVCEP
jgi:hypothetical protein